MRVILLGLLVGLLMAPAGFPATEPVDSAEPFDAEEDLRVEEPHHEDAVARIETNSVTRFTVVAETSSGSEKTWWIAAERATVYRESESISVQVDGSPVDHEIRRALDQEWIVFEAEGDSTTIQISPPGSGAGGFWTSLRDSFLGSPITIVMGATVFVVVASFVVRRVIESDVEYF